jgi:2',3'-cyclic-nucleotide 2'-phosphodiesterase (5'-nucleotidase family)
MYFFSSTQELNKRPEGHPMNKNKTGRALSVILTLAVLTSLFSSAALAAPLGAPASAPGVPVSFTILHTNDFHGQLEGPPGSARIATYINSVRTAVGASNVLLVDAGDQMQGSLLSNMGDGTATGKGKYTIATYNAMGYNLATFGNHEFDWGKVNLANRTAEATFPYISANIVVNNTGDCSTAGWTSPTFVDGGPYQIQTIGTGLNAVKVAFIGVTTQETPVITISTATEGLCFKDPALSIQYYYNDMKAAGADVIVVLSHLGFTDSGGGYGLPVYGDQTLASRLNTAGMPVNLIIGGHSHTDVGGPAPAPGVATIGTTKVVQAANNGVRVGRADVIVGTDGSVSITWTRVVINNTDAQDPAIFALISGPWDPGTGTGGFANNPAYLALVNAPVGWSAVDLPRLGRVVDNMMSTFIDDAIYNYLNTDSEPTNDIDIFFNNGGGIRTDWCWNGADWVTTSSVCVAGTHTAGLLNYGDMFTILPFGNATMVGQMTGAKILEVVNHGPEIPYVAQPAGLKYSYFKYTDAIPAAGTVWAWGAYDVTVYDKATHTYVPLDPNKTYSVGTNEFLAPGGGDGYNAFKYMTNVTSWGDMLNAVNAYVSATYGTAGEAYLGPNGDGSLDGRIIRNGDGDGVYDPGEIVPLSILHHNDSHGNLDKTTYIGYTQLASLITQERGHNPTRTLLLSSGDNIQGDAMSYYFKTAPTGFTSDGTPIIDPTMWMAPVIKLFNSMGYDAMTLGNHEFNFGKDVFTSVLAQATFPILDADVTDSGAYGLNLANGGVGVQPYVTKTIGGDINVAIMGLGNPRIPNYELASNIPGLTFANQLGVNDPITVAQGLLTSLRPTNDVVIALTHLGFTDPTDPWVDTNLVASTSGIDAVIGGHSHTDPSGKSTYSYLAPYKYLPSIVGDDSGDPVIVAQALRYNNTLGEVILGLRDLGGGNYEVVSHAGRYLQLCANSKTGTSPSSSCTPDTPEDAVANGIITPYTNMLTTYNNTVIGSTTVAIDALQAFTQETNGANQQADASVYELSVKHGIPVDFHLSGAMTNKAIAVTGPYPVSLKISDMFTLMPYENSLVVLRMNGPQLKTVLERAYRNYYYYKHVPGYGNYSYYTTCMLVTNSGNEIKYNDVYPTLPSGNNVVSLKIGGVPVDFSDAFTEYRVSTVNYLAAGSCNFNDSPGTSLWPLSQLVADTQYYVRDAVIDYTKFLGTVSPAIEGRLQFVSDPTPPTVSSIIRVDTDPTKLASVDYTVTFSEDVTGVDTADFSFTLSGVTGASVTNVTGGPAVYTVTVNTGTGTGTLRLDVDAGATIKDLAVNPFVGPYTGGETYTVDKTAPTVDSILRVNPNPTNLASVDYTVTFSEDVTGVHENDFALALTDITGASVTGVAGGPKVYTVTVNTGTGDGSLRLDVDAGATIIDLAANPLAGPYTGGATYTVDKTAPTIDSIVRVNPSPTDHASVAFTVTFSETVTGVSAADFTLALTGVTGASITGVAGSGTVYSVTVNTGAGNGTLRLDVDAGATIIDPATNAFVGPYTGGETYTVDKEMSFTSNGTYDGFVLESLENSNIGWSLDSTATSFNLGDALGNRQYRSILHFNTAGLPDNAVITKVTLKIRQQGLVGTDPFTVLGTLRVDMSKPYFGNAPLAVGDFQAAAGLSNVATFGATPVSSWYSALLNSTGRAFINLTGATQFRLRFAIDDNNNNIADYMRFFSGDYATVSLRPTLIIEYYIP